MAADSCGLQRCDLFGREQVPRLPWRRAPCPHSSIRDGVKMKDHTLKRNLDGHEGSRLIVLAHLLALASMGLILQFVLMTSGGTLFLAAAVAPALTGLGIILMASVLIYRYRKAHSLFSFDD